LVELGQCCSAVVGFWPVKNLAELAEGPTGCGKVARGGCLFAWNLSVTRTTVRTEAERRRLATHDTVAALVTRS